MFIGYFKKLGADLVLDLKIAEDLALLESQNEFIERYKSVQVSKDQKMLPMLASSCPGKIIYLFIFTNICLKFNSFMCRLGVLRRENSWKFYITIH